MCQDYKWNIKILCTYSKSSNILESSEEGRHVNNSKYHIQYSITGICILDVLSSILQLEFDTPFEDVLLFHLLCHWHIVLAISVDHDCGSVGWWPIDPVCLFPVPSSNCKIYFITQEYSFHSPNDKQLQVKKYHYLVHNIAYLETLNCLFN
jgi:hypothetical protein